jgi:ketosteroid isomerase-like protein
MTADEAAEFAARWARDWNSHDLERILAHYSPEVLFTSPVAARVVPESGGIIRGAAALRSYWTTALAGVPDLHFTVEAVYAGVDTVAIAYRNQAGGSVCEVLTLGDDGLIVSGHGTYARS